MPPHANNDKLDLKPFLYGIEDRMDWAVDHIHYESPDLTADVKATLQFRKNSTGFTVKGFIKGKAQAPCQNCLAQKWVDFEHEIDEIYVLQSIGKQKDKEHQVQLLDEDFFELVNPMHPFDVLDLVRQCVILNLPTFVACEFEMDECPDAVFEEG